MLAWEYDMLVDSLVGVDESDLDDLDLEIAEGADRMLEPPVPKALRGL